MASVVFCLFFSLHLLAIHIILFLVNTTKIDFPKLLVNVWTKSCQKGLSSSLQIWLMAFSGLTLSKIYPIFTFSKSIVIGSEQTEKVNERMNNTETAFLK